VLLTESYQMLPRYQSKTFCLQGSHNGFNLPSSEERIDYPLTIYKYISQNTHRWPMH